MIRIHEELDDDRVRPDRPTHYRTITNRCEVPCHTCGRPLYVGVSTKREIEREIKNHLDNPLTCSECERELDDLLYR